MLDLNEIPENGKLDELDAYNTNYTSQNSNKYTLESKIPQIKTLNKQAYQKLEQLLLQNLNYEVFNEILQYFNKGKYNIEFNTTENVKFLLSIQKLAKKYAIDLDLEYVISDYKELMKTLDEEKKIDLMEIRLLKMKKKLVKGIDNDDKVLEMMVNKVKERNIDNEEMLKYFAFVKDLPIVNEIEKDNLIIEEIKKCNESIEKKVFLHLYKYKKEHIGVLADKLDIERLELLQVIIRMEIDTDVIVFNRVTDIVEIKY